MSGIGSTRGNSALVAACAAAVMAVGLVGCGDNGTDAKSAATSSPAAKKAATPTPSPTPTLELVDDEESADAGKPITVKVLDNDTLTKGSAPEKIEVALDLAEFTLSIDTPPSHGTAKIDGSTIVYTSTQGYGGEDEFTYRLEVKGVKGVKGAEPPAGTAVVRITVAKPTPAPTPTHAKPTKPAAPKVSYANCDAVRAAGADPIRSGEPGYGSHLDRDGDGVACESSSGGSGGGSGTTGGSGGGSGSTYYANCTAVRAAGAAPIRAGDPGYGRHLDRDGDGVACE